MYIKVYEHLTPQYALELNEPERRVVVALLDNKKNFIDSFDYKQISNQIRFYGESKHYNWNEVPKAKQKLWKTSDFREILFNTRKYGIDV